MIYFITWYLLQTVIYVLPTPVVLYIESQYYFNRSYSQVVRPRPFPSNNSDASIIRWLHYSFM